MKISKKSLVKNGLGNSKNPSHALVTTTTKPSGMPRKSLSGQTIVPGFCISAVSAPSSVASTSGSCQKSSSKLSATKISFRFNNSASEILKKQRVLSGMKAVFPVGRSWRVRRSGLTVLHRKALADFLLKPVRGRPSFFSLGDKYQGKFDF